MKITTQISIIIGCLILGASYFGVQFIKQQSIERQKQSEIAWEKEQISLERVKEIQRKISLNACLDEADTVYWNYVELNGTLVDEEEGTYKAPQYVWNEAEKRKKAKEEQCFKQYK